ncbi:DUF2809 domain-containing protein [uncultured Agrobacterium sp.]|uniref:ribosomal maturation YjgA family protein n=1 Tax=uncultured Agrobacterium sp. TaxID=157277 RepID=UPI0025FD48FB|nr:DUF2809 domain-containing protein [uncultured Agrobacterium sp.]
MTIDSGKFYASRALLFLACILVILTGLALRRYGYAIGLTFPVVKYGGSVLWGAMAYLLIATLLARHRTPRFVVVTACCIAIAVELLRLVHFPALDAFRDTAAGTLLLGRVFSLWNIVCYLTGIVVAARIMRWFVRH